MPLDHQCKTVLVAEDEPLVLMAVSEALRDEGLRVLEASNAQEAQEIIQRDKDIELLITDVHMPGRLNGLDLARWARGAWPGIRIIITSGVVRLATYDIRKLTDAILPKPYTLDELRSTVQSVCT